METHVLWRADWTAANVLALACEGYQPVTADRDLIVFAKVQVQTLASGVHAELLAARAERDALRAAAATAAGGAA
jgi:hypothetical protein